MIFSVGEILFQDSYEIKLQAPKLHFLFRWLLSFVIEKNVCTDEHTVSNQSLKQAVSFVFQDMVYCVIEFGSYPFVKWMYFF